MKKYLALIFFFCLGYSVNFKAQIVLADVAFPGNLFFPGLISIPSNNVIDLNSISNYHFFNPYAFNPAMAGIGEKRQLNLDWNRQYTHAVSMSFEQPIASINSAIGIQYEYNVRGLGKMHRYGVAYNYGFRWKENSQLRIGAQFSHINFKSDDFSSLPLDEDEWVSFPTLDLGMAFQFKELRLGVSVQNVVPKKFARFSEVTETYINKVDTERTLNFSAANTFKLAKRWDWSLAFLLRYNSHEIIDDYSAYYVYRYPAQYVINSNKNQHDFSTYISFQKKYMIGATYRTKNDPVWIGFIGLKLKEKLNLQFSMNMKKDQDVPRFWEALTQYQF